MRLIETVSRFMCRDADEKEGFTEDDIAEF